LKSFKNKLLTVNNYIYRENSKKSYYSEIAGIAYEERFGVPFF